jgi:hypothetical protein
VHTKFVLFHSEFESEQASVIMFNLRPPVKIVDFHGKVTFISVFDGIRDISEAQFIMQLVFNSSNIHRLLCLNVMFTIQM